MNALVGTDIPDVCPAGDPERKHHGYTLRQIWEWRCREQRAGRPSGLYDFYNAHGIPHGMPANQPMSSNDAMGEFEKDPRAFGQAILDGIHLANGVNRQVSVPLGPYANYISVERSRHADHKVLFVHDGNCLTVIGTYEQDWEDLCEKNPAYAAELIRTAETILKYAKARIKKK